MYIFFNLFLLYNLHYVHEAGSQAGISQSNRTPLLRIFEKFKVIQSSKGVAHLRETGLVYNNIYPDVEQNSGLIIPKALIKTENRPQKAAENFKTQAKADREFS